MEQNRTPRMTTPPQLVLRALLADPSKELYGVEIGQAAGLPSGTVHPILARLETVGWLTSRGGEGSPRGGGAPAPAVTTSSPRTGWSWPGPPWPVPTAPDLGPPGCDPWAR